MSPNTTTNLMLFAGSLLLALVSSAILGSRDRDLEFIHCRIPGEYQTPLVYVRLRSAPQQTALHRVSSSPTVFLIHGLSASKSVMLHLGSELAKLGMDSYVIDLPGHGESSKRFTWEDCRRAIREALIYLKLIPATGSTFDPQLMRSPVFLVGHSMGAALAVQTARSESSITGVIAISPAATSVDRSTPRNLLILLGQFDVPFVRRGARFLFQQATGISLPSGEPLENCSNKDGSKKLVQLRWMEHSLGIFDPRALVQMVTWLAHFSPAVRFDPRRSLAGLVLKLSLCCCLLYSLIPGFGLMHRAIGLLRTRRSHSAKIDWRRDGNCEGPLRGLPSLWLYGVAGIVAVAFLLAFNPWDRLRLMGGGYLCGFLCLTGVLALSCRRPPAAMWFCSAADFVSVLLSVSFFVALAAPLFSSCFVHLTLSQVRFWRLPVVALSVYPFYLYDEWVSRRLITSFHVDRLLFFHFSTRLLLALVMILGFFILHNGQFLMVLLLPAMLLLSSLCWCQAWAVYSKTVSVGASATFSALLTAWFLSTFFAQI
jgi:pimeloyl-ACP methyl ester carboxylesterase